MFHPLRITARKDIFWSVSASDLPVRSSGATPREAMDSLAEYLVETVGKLRIRESEDNLMRALFSEHIDLDRPCPDPDVKLCSDV